MKLSLKKPNALLWKTDFSPEEVQEKLTAGKITGDWLVCPLGDAERAVSVSDFFARPSMFDPVSEETPGIPDRESLGEDFTPAPGEKPFDRRHDLDALRATAMLLGIALHGALAYAAVPWVVNDSQTHEFFDTLFSAVHGFRMPLFFMISGFFTAMLWRKRGLSSLLRHRAKRILLPLAIFLIPIQVAGFVVMIGIGIAGASRDGGQDAPAPDTLWTAARDNDVDALENHFESVEDVNQRDPQHQLPALNWAALNGSTEAAAWLIEKGADVNVRSGDNSTPVSHAAFTGRAEVVALLIEKGADLNTVNQYQSTALDNVNANYGIVEWVAGSLGLQVERRSVEAGRKAAAELLKKNGGKRGNELRRGEKADGNDERREFGGITYAYLSFTDSRIFQAFQIFGHLWFLWFLCILILPFGVYALIADRLKWAGPPRWLFLSPVLLFWLVPLTMIPQWFQGLRGPPVFGPDTSLAVFPFPHIVLLYAVYFFFGAFYFDCDDRKGKLGRFWWLTLPVALFAVYPLGMALMFEPESNSMTSWIPDSAVRPLAVTMQALFAWLMIFGLMGLFRKICANENRVIRYVSDSSYWLYLMHIPLIFVAQHLVKPLALPAFVKFAIVCVGLTAVLLLIYEFAVRYTPIGTLLNGKRTRPPKTQSDPEREELAT